MVKAVSWFATWLPLLKLAQLIILFLCIIFLMNTDARRQWWFYSLVYFICFLFAFLVVFTTIIYYVDIHKSRSNIPWTTLELLFNVIAAIVCVVFAVVLIWDSWKMSSGNDWKYHAVLPPRHIGKDAWIRRLRMIGGSLLVAACLFTFSLVKTNRNGIQ